VADSLLDADGDLPREMRAAAFASAAAAAGRPVPDAAPLPEPLAAFVAKVMEEAYRIDDADVDALRAAGYSDDAILEAVLATAVGAGLARLEIGLGAIDGSR
jgi:alkylhydroperoxidase family enzyme